MKRKNKQIINFSVIGLLALAIGGGTSFMAFGGSGGKNTTDIAFIANNGQNWDDGGFMSNSHHAVEEYTNNVKHANFKDDLYGEYDETGKTYVEPTSQALRKGDDIIVSSGFNYAPTIVGQDPTFSGTYDYTGVYGKPVEGTNRSENWGDRQVVVGDDASLAANYSNATSINFYAQGGGFLAGIAAALYSTAAQIYSPATSNNYTNIVTPYAAMAIPANYDYLSGFEQGVNWWNYAALGYTPDSHSENPIDPEFDLDSNKTINVLNNPALRQENNIKPVEVAIIPQGEDKNKTSDSFHYASTKYGLENPAPNDNSYWYIGDFPTDPGNGAGLKAVNIADDSSENNVAAIFPIAGAATMYTYDELDSIGSWTKDEKITQVIGVDSDSLVADPSADKYVLGSATKNLEMGIQYGIWYADSKQESNYIAKDINGNAETIDPWEKIEDSTKFMEPVSEGGWNYSADVNTDDIKENDIPGQQFTGNLENGGSSFTPGVVSESPAELDTSLEYIKKEMDVNEENLTLLNIKKEAIEQNPIIEGASATFTDKNSVNTMANDETLSDDQILKMPWLISYNINYSLPSL